MKLTEIQVEKCIHCGQLILQKISMWCIQCFDAVGWVAGRASGAKCRLAYCTADATATRCLLKVEIQVEKCIHCGQLILRKISMWCIQCFDAVDWVAGRASGAKCRLAYCTADATATHCLLLQ